MSTTSPRMLGGGAAAGGMAAGPASEIRVEPFEGLIDLRSKLIMVEIPGTPGKGTTRNYNGVFSVTFFVHF